MTDEEARIVAREAVHETLQLIGLDVSNPGDLQRDFQFMRSWRLSTETIKRQGLISAVTVIVAGILGLIWIAVKGN